MLNGKLHGYLESSRKDGTLLPSGRLEMGKQIGNWTTCDQECAAYRVTCVK
jgi:hypothetical protein